ncbi:MAG: LPS assembly protein LptD [Marinobacter sp.]|uniref:LPS-assembly protein LptD n=1 Tax=Marinobacter sp. TaxID=50741 RepID=UPI00349FD7B0
MVLAVVLAGPVKAVADQPLTAAETDWRARAELPEAQRNALPEFCAGGYLQPEGYRQEAGMGAVPPDNSGEPLRASGLSARYEIDQTLWLQGDVRLRQGQFDVTGSEARYNQTDGRLSLTGPLVSRGQGVLLTGEKAGYDTGTGRLDIDSATFLLHAAEMRGSALSLSQPQSGQVVIRQGNLTTCAPGQNDWALVASEIELDQIEGVGEARHVRLEIKDVPVFYLPYASFPIDDRRKSGFLYPAFGTSNTGSGGFFSVPYYLNLAPHYDATLTPQYIHGRGLFSEAEGRYLSPLGESVLQLGYIANDGAYEDEEPGADGERWGLDFSTRASFGSGWSGYGDYSVVSDNDYLSDLNRGLEISQATHLVRRGGVRYTDRQQFFELYLNGYQTITDRIADQNKPYDQLPEALYGVERDWGFFETVFEGQYTWFDRDNAGLTGLDRATGQRLRVLPELALPMRALWGYARPSVTLDHTVYELEDYTAGDGSFVRTVPVFEWDSGLYFDRQSTLFDIPYNQTLEPRLYYAWADADDQSFIPDFDSAIQGFRFDDLFSRNRFTGGDRVGDTNQLATAVTTRFNDLNTGAERARLSLGQLYYYDDREVTLNGQGADDRSGSALAGEAVLRPIDTLDIRTSGLWDPRTHQTVEGRSQLVFHSENYRYLATLGHTYRRGEFEQSDIGAVFPVTDNVSLIGRWVYDSQTDRTAGSLAGIEYNNCCWSVQLVSQNYLTDDQTLENRILFQVQLKGLGGSGGSSGRVSEAIYGFEERERRRFGLRD